MRYGADLKLLIVGGGIAGLTIAAVLEQRGMRAEIVEHARGLLVDRLEVGHVG